MKAHSWAEAREACPALRPALLTLGVTAAVTYGAVAVTLLAPGPASPGPAPALATVAASFPIPPVTTVTTSTRVTPAVVTPAKVTRTKTAVKVTPAKVTPARTVVTTRTTTKGGSYTYTGPNKVTTTTTRTVTRTSTGAVSTSSTTHTAVTRAPTHVDLVTNPDGSMSVPAVPYTPVLTTRQQQAVDSPVVCGSATGGPAPCNQARTNVGAIVRCANGGTGWLSYTGKVTGC